MIVHLLGGCLLLLLPASAELKTDSARCPRCVPSECPALPAGGCPLGEAPSPCRCCTVCAAGQGEPCGGRDSKYGRCAQGYECVRSGSKRRSRGHCVCKFPEQVCGSDGVTYSSGCELRAAAQRAQEEGGSPVTRVRKGACEKGITSNNPEDQPAQLHRRSKCARLLEFYCINGKGWECSEAPVIVTKPQEIWNVSGSQVYLSCEVIGVPTPVLTWNKVMKTVTGVEKVELLPGDRDNLAIQTRGGPEKHEVTGWVLISPLTEEDAGEYECYASNTKGEAVATGSIHVVDELKEEA